MLKEVSNGVGPLLPIISAACFAVGLFAGRKIALAAGCKLVGAVAERLGKNADEWIQASDRHWAQAKKDVYRDLSAVAGFAALGFASGYAGRLAHEEQEKPGVLEYYGTPVLKTIDRVSTSVLSTLYEYKKPIVATALTTTAAVIGAAIKFPVQRNNCVIELLQVRIEACKDCIKVYQSMINISQRRITRLEKNNQKIQGH